VIRNGRGKISGRSGRRRRGSRDREGVLGPPVPDEFYRRRPSGWRSSGGRLWSPGAEIRGGNGGETERGKWGTSGRGFGSRFRSGVTRGKWETGAVIMGKKRLRVDDGSNQWVPSVSEKKRNRGEKEGGGSGVLLG
jgi:hypothetical protein